MSSPGFRKAAILRKLVRYNCQSEVLKVGQWDLAELRPTLETQFQKIPLAGYSGMACFLCPIYCGVSI